MHAFLHICMSACIYVRLPACMNACRHICMLACMAYEQAYFVWTACIYACPHACLHVRTAGCIYIYIYIGFPASMTYMWYTLIQYEQLLDHDFIHRLMHDLADTFMDTFSYIYIYIKETCMYKHITYRPAHRPSAFRYMCEYIDIDICIYVYTYVYVQEYVYLYIERYRETFISLSYLGR